MARRCAMRAGAPALIAALAVLAAGTPAGAAPRAGEAGATLEACHEAVSAAGRYAIFGAQMTALPASATMAVRFQLLERAAGHGAFHAVSAPGLGIWQSSASGIGLFRYRQEVADLAVPADYRVAVKFRWLSGGSPRRTLHTAERTSPLCRELDQRPNLEIAAIDHPAGAGDYAVTVRNSGRRAIGPFTVGLDVAGLDLPSQPFAGLAAGHRLTARFNGPACTAGAPLRASVASLGPVDETSSADNVATSVC